ncbi:MULTISPECIES: GxxExxY protein [Sorangium]|uniref:GxxExxY protein n=1 Tax=Sorangium TaxID=39643 RepID=UPI003D9C0EC5
MEMQDDMMVFFSVHDDLPVCRGAQRCRQQRLVGREIEKERVHREAGRRESTDKGGRRDMGTIVRARSGPADVVVEEKLVLELKTVDHLLPVHEAQVLTYPTRSSRR